MKGPSAERTPRQLLVGYFSTERMNISYSVVTPARVGGPSLAMAALWVGRAGRGGQPHAAEASTTSLPDLAAYKGSSRAASLIDAPVFGSSCGFSLRGRPPGSNLHDEARFGRHQTGRTCPRASEYQHTILGIKCKVGWPHKVANWSHLTQPLPCQLKSCCRRSQAHFATDFLHECTPLITPRPHRCCPAAACPLRPHRRLLLPPPPAAPA